MVNVLLAKRALGTVAASAALAGTTLVAVDRSEPAAEVKGAQVSRPAPGGGRPEGVMTFTVTQTAVAASLHPGRTVLAPVAIDNRYGFDMSVTSVTGVAADQPGCPGANVTAALQGGPVRAAGRSSTPATVAMAMAADAPRACSGLTFSITYAGEWVRP